MNNLNKSNSPQFDTDAEWKDGLPSQPISSGYRTLDQFPNFSVNRPLINQFSRVLVKIPLDANHARHYQMDTNRSSQIDLRIERFSELIHLIAISDSGPFGPAACLGSAYLGFEN